ncbi:hypothetical protein ACTUSR_12140 [Pantoea stewartii subsp. indologenes]|uniref:hypothetical protein n=1 Tax=Pantoea stewartii TaxID=66269 RepID=UPI003FA4BA76
MTNIVIRLPGGGRIRKRDEKQDIEWWGYRNYFIDTDFYNDLEKLISKNKNFNFYFISGGVGAFIYTNLCDSLELHKDLRDEVGCTIVSVMHKILIEKLKNSAVRVYPEEISFDDINVVESRGFNSFFVMPEKRFLSTDSLAANVGQIVSAKMIIYIKEGAPLFHVGFDEATVVNAWEIDDIRRRAKGVQGNYILDSDALGVIENLITKNKTRTLILSPGQLKEINMEDDNFGLGQMTSFTEVIK